MITLVRILLGIVWAIWLGGIVATFIFATAMFRNLTREQAGLTNGVLFPTFERYALVAAALALAAAVAWRALSRSRAATVTFALLAVATVALVISAAVVTPRILELRRSGQTESPAFKRAHGQSGMLYVAEAAALLGAGIALLGSHSARAAAKGDGAAPVGPPGGSAAA